MLNDNNMILLFIYEKRNKKGHKIGQFKQTYFVDMQDEQIPIGGLSEPGRSLYFWPEGHRSNSVITDKHIADLREGHEINCEGYVIHKIK